MGTLTNSEDSDAMPENRSLQDLQKQSPGAEVTS